VYHIVPDEVVIEQLAALPPEALAAYAELVDVLGLTPWNGELQHEDKPNGAATHGSCSSARWIRVGLRVRSPRT
jgi:hypothetical protein